MLMLRRRKPRVDRVSLGPLDVMYMFIPAQNMGWTPRYLTVNIYMLQLVAIQHKDIVLGYASWLGLCLLHCALSLAAQCNCYQSCL